MKRISILIAIVIAFASTLSAQTVASGGVVSYTNVSAANTAQHVELDLRNAHDTLSIDAVCSAGTATLSVNVGIDGVSYPLGLDAIVAASPQIKLYTATTAGATIALSPLSFRYVQVVVGTCGGGNTSTLTLSAK